MCPDLLIEVDLAEWPLSCTHVCIRSPPVPNDCGGGGSDAVVDA